MLKSKLIRYGRQFVDEDDIRSVVDALNSTYLTQGQGLRGLNRRFAMKQMSTLQCV